MQADYLFLTFLHDSPSPLGSMGYLRTLKISLVNVLAAKNMLLIEAFCRLLGVRRGLLGA
jgi:hypothetical protein